MNDARAAQERALFVGATAAFIMGGERRRRTLTAIAPYAASAVVNAGFLTLMRAMPGLGGEAHLWLSFWLVLVASLCGGPGVGFFTLALAAAAVAHPFSGGSIASTTPGGLGHLAALFTTGAAIPLLSGAVRNASDLARRHALGEASARQSADDARRVAHDARGAAEESRLRLEGVFDAAGPMLLLDDDLAIVDANRAALDVFARRKDEMIGKPSADLVAGDGRADWPRRWRAPRTGSPLREDAALLGGDGVPHLFEVTASLDVRPHLHVAMLRDVEGPRRTERLTQFLNAASDLLASSFDGDATLAAVARAAVPEIADWAAIDMRVDREGFRRVAVAPSDAASRDAAVACLRCQPGDETGIARVIRTGVPEICEHIPDDVSSDPESLGAMRSPGLASSLSVPLRVQGQCVGAFSLATAAPRRAFRPEDMAFAKELAHRASAALENARTFRESEEANRVKDEFLATISHELRTPLNAILGWTTMLRRKPDVDAKKALDTIERNARAQMRLVEEVLDVSRAVTGKLKIEPGDIDLLDVLRASVEVVTPMADARAVSLDARLEGGPFPFHGDADRLQQALWNVLSNAIKFTGKGGRVSVSLRQVESRVEIVVTDTGRGIHPDFLPFVFDRFRQADSSTTRTEGGLGLGLAIVKHIIELHGGSVQAQSRGEGHGTTFTILLPVRAVQGAASVSGAPKASSGVYLSSGESERAKGLSGVRVLVCDDDEDARELLAAILSAEGAAVHTAETGGAALDVLREFGPHVLVSDVGMPHLDGYDLIRRVRALPQEEGGQTPAIALTAYARREDELKAFLAGYQVHVSKPVEPSRLVQIVGNLVGRPMPRERERPGR